MHIIRDFFHDFSHGLKVFHREPRFAVFVILALGLGIGVNTAVFSLVDAAILRPLPFAAPDRLMHVETFLKTSPDKRQPATPADFLDWRDSATSFSAMAAYLTEPADLILTGNDQPAVVKTVLTTAELFDVLGEPVAQGRSFAPEETWNGGEATAILSHGLWRGQFGGDPKIIGRRIKLDGKEFTVVGIAREGFSFPSEGTQVWITHRWRHELRTKDWFRQAHYLHVVARLAPGVSLQTAQTELATLARQLEQAHPQTNHDSGIAVVPLADWLVRTIKPRLLLLWAVVTLVLLIACVNVANLMGARATARYQELALRCTLGAGRGRLVRQLLAENLPLSLVGALIGLALGYGGLLMVELASPERWPRLGEADLDLTVLVFTLVASVLATLLAGLVPAWFGSRVDLASSLREGEPRLACARRGLMWGRVLVVGQVALALALVFGAGLLLRSFFRLSQVDPGFDPDNVVSVQISLPYGSYPKPDQVSELFAKVLARIEALPSVEAASTVSRLPLVAGDWASDIANVELVLDRAGRHEPVKASQLEVGDRFFETMGLRLLAGRSFGSAEAQGGLLSVLVNQTLAREIFPDGKAIGQRLAFGGGDQPPSDWYTIVGVVADHHQTSLATPPQPELYRPLSQELRPRQDLVIRSRVAPQTLVSAVQQIVQTIDPNLPLMRSMTLDEVVSRSLGHDRFLALLMLTFGGLGLLLAGLGIYGVTSFSVTLRTAEIGTRMALGADRGMITRQFVKEGVRLAAGGLVLGLPAAWLLGQWLSPLLFEVEPHDLGSLAGFGSLMVLVGTIASSVPAHRAACIDPAMTLHGVWGLFLRRASKGEGEGDGDVEPDKPATSPAGGFIRALMVLVSDWLKGWMKVGMKVAHALLALEPVRDSNPAD